jgi:hypothetical protein
MISWWRKVMMHAGQVLGGSEKGKSAIIEHDIFIYEGTHACLESKGLNRNMSKSVHGQKFVLALSAFAADVAG